MIPPPRRFDLFDCRHSRGYEIRTGNVEEKKNSKSAYGAARKSIEKYFKQLESDYTCLSIYTKCTSADFESNIFVSLHDEPS